MLKNLSKKEFEKKAQKVGVVISNDISKLDFSETLKLFNDVLEIIIYCNTHSGVDFIFNSKNDCGKDTSGTITKNPEVVFLILFSSISKFIEPFNIDIFKSILNLLNSFYVHSNSRFNQKNALFEFELKYIEEKIIVIPYKEEKETFLFLMIRRDIILKSIENFEKIVDAFPHIQKEHIENYYVQYNLIKNKIIDTYMHFGKYFDCYEFLKGEVEYAANNCTDLLLRNLNSILDFNQLFLIETKEDLKEFYLDYKDLLDKEGQDFIDTIFKLDLVDIEHSNFINYFKKIESNSDIVNTKIEFTIPYEVILLNKNDEYVELNNNIDFKIRFKKINRYTQDALYPIIRNFHVSGVTIDHLSDANFIDKESATSIEIYLTGFQRFSFNINSEGNVLQNDYTEIDALIGRKYYPEKEAIIKLLRQIEADKKISFPIKINRNEINIDLFSSYRMTFVDKDNLPILEIVNSFTSPFRFAKASKRYVDRLNDLNLEDKVKEINQILSVKINTSKDLRRFLTKIIVDILKFYIRLKDGYVNFWRDTKFDTPKGETEIQPYISNVVDIICRQKGIRVSCEPRGGGGEMDILFSYTNIEGRSLSVCLELKTAHHDNVETSIKTQLPRYLKSENTNQGIYLVMWFDYSKSKKKKYQYISELNTAISKNKPNGNDIDIIILDCTKPISPSKIK